MKKVLITGANSYIGQSVENWLLQTPEAFTVDTLDMVNPKWREFDFTPYDCIFHVAGIAHFSKDKSKKDLYYKINTDLTEETAMKAKKAGVKQFIFMSSIIVYGDSTKANRVITSDTQPNPSDFYGDSKLQAEKRIIPLQDEQFKIVIVRPPMIYGRGSKGNYPRLAKLSQKLPIIPDYKNARSMLYIGNLCEFIKQIILNQSQGLFFPQNREYVSTSNMMEKIAKVHGRTPLKTTIFNPIINKMFFNDSVKKMFGNLTYEKELSEYEFEYSLYNFEKSIEITEY
ncbi:NAD-dependent epimerase/dehydratase family protein [Streptococcus pseudoporcinus]|uniref:3-beta hydroxysteroid dehydrogenase n=1 Tax=Streptococcus pseudoporcinus TaxID=361101 RepID=A0A4U9XRK6_9STRE|nr:NAD-dependent epimerase/dehydratase family protein [Streptococcus pseudoporcinus]VTS15498.1 3-beta hydroxysteroid dehydrogenase [Streptococcus pseudoporcinus]VUC67623.1 3-beta hydroxysteroid dehydrogenase [Streptococcus pseudoporcinus]VUC98550.1 3-beta hydroxysteroid dehydrogenase [Streptococcus pseudoporcinus]VUC98942.1 3-beta hydroxysteroid dehydrogenase [Streptococcus pseudoporcinus]